MVTTTLTHVTAAGKNVLRKHMRITVIRLKKRITHVTRVIESIEKLNLESQRDTTTRPAIGCPKKKQELSITDRICAMFVCSAPNRMQIGQGFCPDVAARCDTRCSRAEGALRGGGGGVLVGVSLLWSRLGYYGNQSLTHAAGSEPPTSATQTVERPYTGGSDPRISRPAESAVIWSGGRCDNNGNGIPPRR